MLRAAEGYLRQRSVDAPRRSAELLMGRVTGLSRLELYLAHDRPIDETERRQLREWVAARGRHVPVAYLLGDWEFFGLELEVTPDVLIPRPETEHLVELAVERAPKGALCGEIGTGSGAIAVALAVQRPDVRILASELSPAAAAIARRNVARHEVADRVTILEGATWEPFDSAEALQLLVANPPYVDPDQPELLAADVRQYEPHLALFTEPGNPASAYDAIFAGVSRHVQSGAWLLFETGVGAAEQARQLLERAPFAAEVRLAPDLAGIPRYLTARVS